MSSAFNVYSRHVQHNAAVIFISKSISYKRKAVTGNFLLQHHLAYYFKLIMLIVPYSYILYLIKVLSAGNVALSFTFANQGPRLWGSTSLQVFLDSWLGKCLNRFSSAINFEKISHIGMLNS